MTTTSFMLCKRFLKELVFGRTHSKYNISIDNVSLLAKLAEIFCSIARLSLHCPHHTFNYVDSYSKHIKFVSTVLLHNLESPHRHHNLRFLLISINTRMLSILICCPSSTEFFIAISETIAAIKMTSVVNVLFVWSM